MRFPYNARPLAGVLKRVENPGSPGFFRFPIHPQSRSTTLDHALRRTMRRTFLARRTALPWHCLRVSGNFSGLFPVLFRDL